MKRIGLAMCLPMLWTSAVLIGQEPSPRAPASAAPAQQGSSDSDQDAIWIVGRYVYYADAATFVDCVGGSRYPVAQERDNAALEAAYLEARPNPMAELVVALEGHLARRPSREGDRQATVVIVERFAGIRGSGECPANVDLERTTWDVLALDGDDVEIPVGPTDSGVHLRLQPADGRVIGALGCNRFFGRYTLTDQNLSFGAIGSTNMFCAGSMDIEGGFLRVLEATTGFEVDGDILELTADGRTLATLQARTLH